MVKIFVCDWGAVGVVLWVALGRSVLLCLSVLFWKDM